MISKPLPGSIINPFNSLYKNIVGYWLLNESGGSLSNDLSQYKNNGYIKLIVPNKHEADWGSGYNGKGLHFDGIDVHVEVPSSPSLNSAFGTESFTLMAWIFPIQRLDFQSIINKRTSFHFSATPGGLFIENNGTTIRFVIGTGNDGETYDSITSTVSLNTWSCWVATAGGGTMELYNNGKLVAGPSTITKNPPTNNDILTIGSFLNDSRCFRGIMDQIMICNRKLTPFEIYYLYYNLYTYITQIR